MDKGVKTSPKTEPKKTGTSRKTHYLVVTTAIVAVVAAVAVSMFLVSGPPVAANSDDVSVYYVGMFGNGTVVDSNMNGTPLEFTLGNASQIPPGFQDAIVGMNLNQSKTVTIPVAILRTVNRTGLLQNITFVEGQLYTIHRKTDNAVSVVKILNVTPTTVTWDENGLLAGQNLTFTIWLVGIHKHT